MVSPRAWAVAYLEAPMEGQGVRGGDVPGQAQMEGRGVGVRTAEAIIAEVGENGVVQAQRVNAEARIARAGAWWVVDAHSTLL